MIEHKFAKGFLIMILAVGVTTPAYAYLGPGAGLGAIGTVIGLIVAVLLLLVGFVWYPMKRLLRKRRHTGGQTESVTKDTAE